MHSDFLIIRERFLQAGQSHRHQSVHTAGQTWVPFVDDFQDEAENAQTKICSSELVLRNFLRNRLNGFPDLLVKLLGIGPMLQDLVQDEIGNDSCLQVAKAVVRKIRCEQLVHDYLMRNYA